MNNLHDKIVALMYPPPEAGNYWEAFTGACERVQRYYVDNPNWDDWTPEMQQLAQACWLILGINDD